MENIYFKESTLLFLGKKAGALEDLMVLIGQKVLKITIVLRSLSMS
jgi:hypothetical protein